MVNHKLYSVYIDPKKALRPIGVQILKEGSSVLENSHKNPKFGISDREMFGLWVIYELRKQMEPEKTWFISADSDLSDDGVVGHMTLSDTLTKVNYTEAIEQVYLPGNFLKREPNELATDFLLRHTVAKKANGAQYERSKSLFVLNDASSGDPFYWAEFAKKFFMKTEFLHLYFLILEGRFLKNNKYYLISFTNQLHRQYLNGEFRFQLTQRGIQGMRRVTDLTHALDGLPKVKLQEV